MADGMDTFEARQRMRELAAAGLELVNRFGCGETSMRTAAEQARALSTEARTVLADAGYPGESTWRALQRTESGLSSLVEPPLPEYWDDITIELSDAGEALDRLLTIPVARDADFRIVG